MPSRTRPRPPLPTTADEQTSSFPRTTKTRTSEADAEAGGEVELSATATQAEKDEPRRRKKPPGSPQPRWPPPLRPFRDAPANGGNGAAEEDDDEPEDTFEEPVQVAPNPIAPRRDQRRERERERRRASRRSGIGTASGSARTSSSAPRVPRPRDLRAGPRAPALAHRREEDRPLLRPRKHRPRGARLRGRQVDINLVLERLLEKGKIIVKKAYADWERYSDYKRPFHEAAIELIDIPQKYYSGKNSADIKMVVDAMDLSYSKEHLDTFVLLSGDSDFSPLVSKLKENNKYVIGIGVKNSSSNLLVDNCDEFIYYETSGATPRRRRSSPASTRRPPSVSLMVESIQALVRETRTSSGAR